MLEEKKKRDAADMTGLSTAANHLRSNVRGMQWPICQGREIHSRQVNEARSPVESVEWPMALSVEHPHVCLTGKKVFGCDPSQLSRLL